MAINDQLYAVVLHLASIITVAVLLATKTIDQLVGLPILAGLLGIALPSPVKG